ncbi:MAG: hypothetical protein DLM72_07420, partial [Candidatus Nitrosopolaris wilkensis]
MNQAVDQVAVQSVVSGGAGNVVQVLVQQAIQQSINQQISQVAEQTVVKNPGVRQSDIEQIIHQVALQTANKGGNTVRVLSQILDQFSRERYSGQASQSIVQLARQLELGDVGTVNQAITQ